MGKRKGKLAAGTNKIGRKRWTTSEQLEYLETLVPGFIATQASKTTSEGWPGIFEGWFERWAAVLTADDISQGKSVEDVIKTTKAVS